MALVCGVSPIPIHHVFTPLISCDHDHALQSLHIQRQMYHIVSKHSALSETSEMAPCISARVSLCEYLLQGSYWSQMSIIHFQNADQSMDEVVFIYCSKTVAKINHLFYTVNLPVLYGKGLSILVPYSMSLFLCCTGAKYIYSIFYNIFHLTITMEEQNEK